MKVVIKCPCGTNMRVDASAAGRTVTCPKCQQKLRVPSDPSNPNSPAAGKPPAKPNKPTAKPTPPSQKAATPRAPKPSSDVSKQPDALFFKCPCGQKMKSSAAAGSVVSCPKCNTKMKVPERPSAPYVVPVAKAIDGPQKQTATPTTGVGPGGKSTGSVTVSLLPEENASPTTAQSQTSAQSPTAQQPAPGTPGTGSPVAPANPVEPATPVAVPVAMPVGQTAAPTTPAVPNEPVVATPIAPVADPNVPAAPLGLPSDPAPPSFASPHSPARKRPRGGVRAGLMIAFVSMCVMTTGLIVVGVGNAMFSLSLIQLQMRAKMLSSQSEGVRWGSEEHSRLVEKQFNLMDDQREVRKFVAVWVPRMYRYGRLTMSIGVLGLIIGCGFSVVVRPVRGLAIACLTIACVALLLDLPLRIYPTLNEKVGAEFYLMRGGFFGPQTGRIALSILIEIVYMLTVLLVTLIAAAGLKQIKVAASKLPKTSFIALGIYLPVAIVLAVLALIEFERESAQWILYIQSFLYLVASVCFITAMTCTSIALFRIRRV